MLVYMEQMVWRLLAAIAPGRPSLVVLASPATVAVSVAMHSWPTVCASLHLNGFIGCPCNDPSFQQGQNGVSATFLRRHGVLRWDLVGDNCFEDEDAVQTLGNRP
jgi:hypothetical protein